MAKTRRPAQGRLKQRTPVAVIDIGSNSVRQVIYEGLTRAPAVLFNEKVLCGLGRGVAATGKLDPEAMDRALGAIRRFRALGRQAGAGQTFIFATAAARDASNGPSFIAQVEQLGDERVTLLSGAMEARYCALGVFSGFCSPSGIAGDMGGGSLELVGVGGEPREDGITLPLGGLRLAEAAGGSVSKAAALAERALDMAAIAWPDTARTFYAVGGTWRSLAKLHIGKTRYPLQVVHGYRRPAKRIIRFCEEVAAGELDRIPGIETVSQNRRRLLPFGAAVLAACLRRTRAKTVIVSSFGVREGFLYSLLSETERARDPLLEATRDLALLRARSPDHSQELADWSGAAFDLLGIDETDDERRYRVAACYLADVAWRAQPDYRATHAAATIANPGLVGVDHPGRAFLTLAAFHRYKGLGGKVRLPAFDKVAGQRLRTRARLLAAIFRVLYLYSASIAGVLPRLQLRQDGDGFAFRVPRALADLHGERPELRVSQLAREAGVRISVVTG